MVIYSLTACTWLVINIRRSLPWVSTARIISEHRENRQKGEEEERGVKGRGSFSSAVICSSHSLQSHKRIRTWYSVYPCVWLQAGESVQVQWRWSLMMMIRLPSGSNSSHGLRGEQSPVWIRIYVIRKEHAQTHSNRFLLSCPHWPH